MANILPVRPMPDCTSSAMIQDAVLVAQLPQLAMEFRRRDDVAPFALDRLDDDRRHFLRGDGAAEEVFELVERFRDFVAER